MNNKFKHLLNSLSQAFKKKKKEESSTEHNATEEVTLEKEIASEDIESDNPKDNNDILPDLPLDQDSDESQLEEEPFVAQEMTKEAFDEDSESEITELPDLPTNDSTDESIDVPGVSEESLVDMDSTKEIDITALNNDESDNEPAEEPINEGYSLDDTTGDLPIISEEEINAPLTFKDKMGVQRQKLVDLKNRVLTKKSFPIKKPEGTLGEKIPLDKLKKGMAKLNESPQMQKLFANIKKNNIPWDKLLDTLLDKENKQTINRVLIIAVLTILPYQLGKLTGLLLKSDTKFKPTPFQLNLDSDRHLTQAKVLSIKSAELFQTKKVEGEKKVDDGPATPEICLEASSKSNLPIEVLSTTVLQNSAKSMTSLIINKKDVMDVREGDKVDTLAIIGRIEPWKIILKNKQNDQCEYIEGESGASIRPEKRIAVMSKNEAKNFKAKKKVEGILNDGNSFTIDKKVMQEKLNNIQDLLSQARGIPISNPDGTMSFKIVDIQPGSVYSFLGIQDNDLITEINGKKISSMNEVMSLFGNISNLSKLNLTVERGGSPETLDYKIK